MSEKWHQSQIRIEINDKSQGTIAKHLMCDELRYYTFIIQSAGERIFKLGEHSDITGKMADCVIHPIRIAPLSSKMQISPDKLNNLYKTDINCY